MRISFTKLYKGKTITANIKVWSTEFLSEKMAKYLVSIINQDGKKVAIFKGQVHRTSTIWFSENE